MDAMERLSLVLWRERELLESLHFKLEVEQLVLASGRSRWLMHAARDVEAVLDDDPRDRGAARRRRRRGRGVDRHAVQPEPQRAGRGGGRAVVHDPHRAPRRRSSPPPREITALADSNRDLISAGYRSARETLLSLGETTDGYAADGTATAEPARHRLVDRSL